MRPCVRAIMLSVLTAAGATSGCQTSDLSRRSRPEATLAPAVTTAAAAGVTPAAASTTLGEATSSTVPAVTSLAAPTAESPLTIADLEQLALTHNPTLVQAATYIDAARGKALQAGLPFNPTAGITGEQIGADRKAGEWTWFSLQQQIVTGGKLRLSQQKYEVEAELAEIQACAQRLKVVNGLASAFYDVLAAQRTVEYARRLAENAEEAVKTTEQMLNVGQANQQDLLQAQVESSQARVAVRTAESKLRKDWLHLATQVGVPELPFRPLIGQLEPDGLPLLKEESLARVLQESPELAFAVTKVKQDQVQLEREKREPIPNVTLRGGVGYNYETRNSTALVALSLPIPVFDRNQGTVNQAIADLLRSQAEVTRVQLDIRRRFADAFARYETAQEEGENFREQVLPKARKVEELYGEQFKNRRAAFPQVLVARRMLFQLTEEYNHSLRQFRRAEVEVRGLLLVDGLTAPPTPTPPGHIGATPKPR